MLRTGGPEPHPPWTSQLREQASPLFVPAALSWDLHTLGWFITHTGFGTCPGLRLAPSTKIGGGEGRGVVESAALHGDLAFSAVGLDPPAAQASSAGWNIPEYQEGHQP